jgi:hypothetical protein
MTTQAGDTCPWEPVRVTFKLSSFSLSLSLLLSLVLGNQTQGLAKAKQVLSTEVYSSSVGYRGIITGKSPLSLPYRIIQKGKIS